jgi:hypothetical protein
VNPARPLAWLLIIYAATAWVWNPLAPWVSWEGLSATAALPVGVALLLLSGPRHSMPETRNR